MQTTLSVPGDKRRGALLLRPWTVADLEGLTSEMAADYPTRGLHPPGPRTPAKEDAWIATQDLGWRNADWLTFGIFEDAVRLVGQVGLKPREAGTTVALCGVGEVSYWTAASARGRGIASAAIDRVTSWAFKTFDAEGLREIMAVHDVDNPASCRVAENSGYRFERVSPANPPLWFTDGHIHTRRRPALGDTSQGVIR